MIWTFIHVFCRFLRVCGAAYSTIVHLLHKPVNNIRYYHTESSKARTRVHDFFAQEKAQREAEAAKRLAVTNRVRGIIADLREQQHNSANSNASSVDPVVIRKFYSLDFAFLNATHDTHTVCTSGSNMEYFPTRSYRNNTFSTVLTCTQAQMQHDIYIFAIVSETHSQYDI